MSELIDFLRARVAEDEAVAKEAASRSAAVADDATDDGWPNALVPGAAGHGTVEASPGRVLAECSAKLKLIDYLGLDADEVRSAEQRPLRDRDAETAALQLLALPYAEHSEYQEGWRVI